VLKDKPYADVAGVGFHELRSKDPAALRVWKDTEQLCDYQYQVYTEGNSWSGALGRRRRQWGACIAADQSPPDNRSLDRRIDQR
jgi:hypothetical protein